MRSRVADEIREAQRQEMLALSVEQRIELVRRLSEEGIALLMASENIDRDEAIRRIHESHSRGRRRRRKRMNYARIAVRTRWSVGAPRRTGSAAEAAAAPLLFLQNNSSIDW